LQPGSRDAFLAAAGAAALDIGREIDVRDFEETAALIQNLDLVITCDTAVGHLAGALGKTVWVLVPFYADWRWLAEREDSPWYPHTRVFRQTRRGGWEELFERVVQRLQAVAGEPARAG
jgi:ADP-heptose:LPS heptosyltransferase